MIRTQVQLDEDQYARLKRLSTRTSKSIAQLLRDGAEHVLKQAERRERWSQLWMAVGSCHDERGAGDVAARHDEYLREIYGR